VAITSAVSTATGYTPLTAAIRDIYSRKILFEAQPRLLFAQFAEERLDLAVQPGGVVRFLKYSNLQAGGSLTEDEKLEDKAQALSAQSIEITVTEWGNAVAVTERALLTAFTDVMADTARLLGMDYAKTVDTAVRDVLFGVNNVIYAPAISGGTVTEISARAEITTDCGLSVHAVKDALEFLATNNAPPVARADNYFVCFAHPHQIRALKDDREWQEAHLYGSPETLFNGEVGRLHRVRFIETTQCPIVAGAGSGGIDVYRAVLFGENASAIAWALPVELRDGGVKDLGRLHILGWYAVFGVGVLVPENVVIVETA